MWKEVGRLYDASSASVQFNSSKGHPSMVSLPSNEHWKAVRKEAAACFSTSNMKRSYPYIRVVCQQLIDVVKNLGPAPVVDFDDALCRESLDVIGTCRPRFRLIAYVMRGQSIIVLASTIATPCPQLSLYLLQVM